MPNTALAEQIKTMLEEVKGQLETKTEDGQVIKLLDVFKMFPALQEKYTSLEKRLEEFEKQAKSRKWATGLAGLELEKDKFSLCRALHAMRTNNWDKAQFEADVFRQTRALSTGDDSSGGYLVPGSGHAGVHRNVPGRGGLHPHGGPGHRRPHRGPGDLHPADRRGHRLLGRRKQGNHRKRPLRGRTQDDP